MIAFSRQCKISELHISRNPVSSTLLNLRNTVTINFIGVGKKMMLEKGRFLSNPVIFLLFLIFVISSVNHVGLPEFSEDSDSPD